MVRRAIILCCGLTTGGCASAPAGSGGVAGPDACVILPSGTGRDTVWIGVPDPIPPHRFDQPAGRGAEILVAAVQETLVETDCHGQPVPALASRWSSDASRRIWSFVLRPDAVFTDGSPVDARGVAAAWIEAGRRAAPGTHTARARVQNVEVTGTRELTVELDEPADVAVFADPSLGVRRYVDSWPVGTGPYEIVRPARRWADREVLVKLELSDAAASRWGDLPHALHFLGMESSDDLRTALDLGIDAVVSRESGVLDYARALGGFEFTPLPWDMTHSLVAPAATANVTVPDSARASLARDAVRVDAIAAPLATAEGADEPSTRRSRDPSAGSSARIVYLEDDDVGRGIAERLVALAAREERAPWLDARLPRGVLRTQGLSLGDFMRALQTGGEAGYMIQVTEETRREVMAAVSRIGVGPAEAILTPLIMTRRTLIHRPWVGPLRIDAKGALRFGLPPERTER